MSGEIQYVDGFEKRMNLLHPTMVEMNQFLHAWKPTLTTGVEEFINSLRQHRKQIFLVSGGISHVCL
mgnify:CR=1 FL=1